MKKPFIALMVAILPLCANAQNEGIFAKKNTTVKTVDYSPYMQGTVPEINGNVVFTQTITAPNKSKEDLYKAIASWTSIRFMPDIENGKWTDKDYFHNLALSGFKTADAATGHIVCQGNEELVFSNKFLEKDYSEIEYTFDISIKDGSITVTLSNIVYVYTFTSEKERFTAESFITDEASFTKKGKFIKDNRKFRVKTINLKDELVSEIETVIK